jgi:hypothetical protein
MAMFKVVNSTVKPSTSVFCSSPLKIGEWFGILDLIVAMFLDATKRYGVPMMTRRRLG